MRYDRARVSLDRHATYIVATYIAAPVVRKNDRSGRLSAKTDARAAVSSVRGIDAEYVWVGEGLEAVIMCA